MAPRKKAESGQDAEPRTATEGTPPVAGAEGGIIEEGTGDYAPEAGVLGGTEHAGKTVTRTDAQGNEIEVPVGIDGENAVSANNPSPKHSLGGSNPKPGSD